LSQRCDLRVSSFGKLKFGFCILSVPLFLVSLFLAPMAQAQSSASIGVQPEIFTKTLSLGEKWEDVIKIVNGSNDAMPISLSLVRWDASDETGGVNFIEERGDPSFDATHWFNLSDTEMILAPKEVREITFTVEVPSDAEPGGKYVSLWIDTKIPDIYFGDKPVRIIPRVTALFLLDIPTIGIDAEDLAPSAQVAEFAVADRAPIMSGVASRVASLFRAPSTVFASNPAVNVNVLDGRPDGLVLRVENEGITHIRPFATLSVRNALGANIATVQTEPTTILPRRVRQLPLEIESANIPLLPRALERQLALGRYTATAVVSGVGDEPIIASLTYWVFPWQSLLLSLLFFGGGGVLTFKFRSRFKVAFKVLLRGKK